MVNQENVYYESTLFMGILLFWNTDFDGNLRVPPPPKFTIGFP